MKMKKLMLIMLGSLIATSTVLGACGSAEAEGSKTEEGKEIVELKWYFNRTRTTRLRYSIRKS